jgi:diguanylate cyclase (GGDEF)-like protein
MEYPCHSPKENRWFIGRVTPLQISQIGAVISHTDITDRKLLEFELIKLAETDPLTGLPNRRSFLETANLEVERVTRYSVVASLITIDLDYFKAVNDTHGHAAGDAALFCFAQVCKKILRNIDTLARLGGDEFVVLLPRTNKSDAVNVAEKLRRAVATTPVESGQRQFNITASFGVAEVLAGDKGIAECLHRADSFLYAAKRAGHNCVMSVDVAPSRA